MLHFVPPFFWNTKPSSSVLCISFVFIPLPYAILATMIGWLENAYCAIAFQRHEIIWVSLNIHRNTVLGVY